VQTPLGAAPWTLAIELQAYLIFLFLARFVMKKPRTALPMMFAAAFLWRGYHLWALNDYNMVVNQLPSFLDVYAVGMLAAMAYVALLLLFGVIPPRRVLCLLRKLRLSLPRRTVSAHNR